MRWLITAVLFLLMLAAQATAAPRLDFLGLDARPNFLIILVVQLALLSPRIDTVIWSWVMGLLVDLHDANPPGVLALTYMLIALVTHRIRSQIFAGHIITRLLLVVIADFLQHLALMFAEIIRGHPLHFLLFWRRTVISIVYTAAVGVVLLPLLSLMFRYVYGQRRRT